jgi:CRISPR-associated protein Cas5 subtype I-A
MPLKMLHLNLIALRVKVIFHWGFWIHSPFTSKYQASLSIPPPTTLIGALAEPLYTLNLTKTKIGETTLLKNKVTSSASLLEDVILATSFYYESGSCFSYVDINKYITLHFQSKVEEGGVRRRYLPKYRTGALQVGKVSFPSGRGVACYLIDLEKVKEKLGTAIEDKLRLAACSISRIGSKESIVCVQSVDIVKELTQISTPTTIKTKCYIPLRFIDIDSIEGDYYIEQFWRRGWSEEDKPIYEDFIVPGTRTPISTKTINVGVKQGVVYQLGPEEVLCSDTR